MKGWSGRRVTVDVRPCPCGTLWVAEVRTHFLFGSFGISMFGPVVEEAKKITQVVMPFPEGTRISFRYSSALAALPIT